MSVRKSSYTSGRGIHGEPAYVLHRYEWSESSLILELFTRNHGRLAAAAKGVRKPASAFRSVLLPFQPLLISLGSQAEIRSLRGAEWAGGYAMPTGEPLIVSYYMNELLLRLLARDDVQPLVFDAYAQTLAVIAGNCGEKLVQPMLRAFELVLLKATGVLPALDVETMTLRPLQAQGFYTLDPESGLVLSSLGRGEDAGPDYDRSLSVLPATQWLAINAALESSDVLQQLPLAVQSLPNSLKLMLRAMLNHHAGVASLKTRQLMQALQKRTFS